jgi:hypothetical protein
MIKHSGNFTFFHCLFSDAVSNSDSKLSNYISLGNNELERRERELLWLNLKQYPDNYLASLRKNKKTHIDDTRSPGNELDQGSPEHGAGVPTARQQQINEEQHRDQSVFMYIILNVCFFRKFYDGALELLLRHISFPNTTCF